MQFQPVQARDESVPHPPVAQRGKQSQGEEEVHAHARGQVAHTCLDGAGLLQHVVDEFEGDVLGQLAQVTRSEDARGDGDGARQRGGDKLLRQWDLSGQERLGRLPASTRGPVPVDSEPSTSPLGR